MFTSIGGWSISGALQNVSECAGYIPIADEHLYTVLHRVEDPRARLLFVGPFASERHFSYTPCVQWARFLAARHVESLRFDYRGVGESTGDFGAMGFDDWSADTALLADWLQQRAPQVPVILHGFELGALLAGRLFARGIGDVLLTWNAPATANQILRGILARHVAADNMFKYGGGRRLFGDYVGELEASALDVEGYHWSAGLWRESFEIKFPPGLSFTPERPVRSVRVQAIATARFGEIINPDLTDLFSNDVDWMVNSLSLRHRGCQ